MNYFLYCQFCVFENRCRLRHSEYLMGDFSEILGGCQGEIVYNQGRLKCKECGTTIERQVEKGLCKKFNPDPVVPIGEFPSFRRERRRMTIKF